MGKDKVTEEYGSLLFTDQVMQERLPKPTYKELTKVIKEGKALDLDIANEELIIEEAKKVARSRNIAILSSLHDLNQALYFGDRFFFLKDGRVKYSGGQDMICPEIIKDIFDINSKIIEHDGKKIILGGKQYEN